MEKLLRRGLKYLAAVDNRTDVGKCGEDGFSQCVPICSKRSFTRRTLPATYENRGLSKMGYLLDRKFSRKFQGIEKAARIRLELLDAATALRALELPGLRPGAATALRVPAERIVRHSDGSRKMRFEPALHGIMTARGVMP